MTPPWVILFALLLIISSACQTQAGEPQRVGWVEFGREASELTVSPDGRWAIARMAATGSQPAGLQVIDLVAPDRPRLRAFVRVDAEATSISSDGRQLLLMVHTPAFGVYSNEHRVVALDLTDPDNPRVAWDRKVPGSKTALIPNALGYADVLPAASAAKAALGIGRIEVHWSDGRPGTIVDDDAAQWTTLSFSPDGRMLMLDQPNLHVVDLSAEQPVVHRQVGFSSIERYACLRVLDSGNILVRSALWPRLEVLALREGLPRLGDVSVNGGYDVAECAGLQGSAAGAIFLKDADNRIAELDLARPEQPNLGRFWSLPGGTAPAAVDNAHRLFAFEGGHRDRLAIYDLDHVIAAHVDWSALWAARNEALRVYASATNYESGHKARAILEQAGVRAALEAPIEGITAQRAAAILNDYGFLLTKAGFAWSTQWTRGPSPAEPYLRRTIELDPDRAVAYLNLADVLRGDLGRFTDWTVKAAKAAEAERLYRRYLALGGAASPAIQASLRGDLGKESPADICGAIAAYADAGRLGELVSFEPTGVSSGGRKIDLAFSVQGSAKVPVVEDFDTNTGAPLDQVSRITEDAGLWGGDQLGLVVYRNAAHILHFRDLRHPVATFLLTGARACEFKPAVTQVVGPRAREPALCEQLASGKGPPLLAFSNPAPISEEEVSSRYMETAAAGMRSFDVLNDGTRVNVVQLELTSGAGPGCSQTFYETVDQAGAHFAPGSARDLLMALQSVDPNGRYPIGTCGNAPRFFEYGGKTYYETTPAFWPPQSDIDEYHRVERAQGGKAVEVCDFKFTTRTTIVTSTSREH